VIFLKSTGVVRRIDDLGRIVIPKEIRKNMKIKDGESVEIYLDSDNIILKKYSPLGNIMEFYKSYVNSIYEAILENIMIVDRDKVVAVAGDLKKKYLDKSISSKLDNIIEQREVVLESKLRDFNFIEDKKETASYAISPIIVSGDAIGAVIIFSLNNNLGEFEEKTVSIAAKFLGKYIEE